MLLPCGLESARWSGCIGAGRHLRGRTSTLLGHNEEVAVSVAEAGVVHGFAGGIHVDRIPLLTCRAAQPQGSSMGDERVQACPVAAHKQVLLSCRCRAASGGSDTAQHPRSQSGKNVLYQPDVQMVVSPCAKSVGRSGKGKGCQRS